MNVLLITGSARPNSVGKIVAELVAEQLELDPRVKVQIADLATIELPFYDNPASPSSSKFEINHPVVEAWSNQVNGADAVVFIMPEYNHSMTALQKNAIDWLYTEWLGKPAAIVAYGYYGGKHAIDTFMAINDTIKTKLVDPVARLTIGEHLAADGVVLDSSATQSVISATTSSLINRLDNN